jgi:AFG1-like ATPase
LCDQNLGAADYIELAKIFQVIFITDIPEMTLANRNEIRRFITCIDALYEGHVHVIASADQVPLKLLNVSAEERKTSHFDEMFAFDRTVSRLLEMQSLAYIETINQTQLYGCDLVEKLVPVRASAQANNEAVVEKLWDYYKVPHIVGIDEHAIPSQAVHACIRDIQLVAAYRTKSQPQLEPVEVSDESHLVSKQDFISRVARALAQFLS